MDYSCPYCGASLEGKRLKRTAHPRERKFLPLHVAFACASCGEPVEANLNALEKYLLVTDLLLTLALFSIAFALESKVLLLVAIVVATVPYIVVQKVLPHRLVQWPRYKKVGESPNFSSSGRDVSANCADRRRST